MTQETIPMPPRMHLRGPTLATVNEVERILRTAGEPLSLNEVKRRMKAKSVQHSAVRMAIDHLGRFGLVVEGSKGVVWLPPASPKILAYIRRGKQL